MKSPFKFAQHGQSGRMGFRDLPEHGPACRRYGLHARLLHRNQQPLPCPVQVNTGFSRMGFPSVGAWVTYGLGSVSQNLPAFVVMYDTLGRGLPKGYAQNWGAGFLPGIYQGTALNAQGAPIDNLARTAGMTEAEQQNQLALLNRLNRRQLEQHPAEAEFAARIESFELGYRMQMAAPRGARRRQRAAAMKKLYGLDNPKCTHFSRQCLIARRMIERGVRFVQIYSGGTENEKSWDGHTNIADNHRQFAGETDMPIAALLADLKQRGLMESTLVVWNGEFGTLADRAKRGEPAATIIRTPSPRGWPAPEWRGGVHHGDSDEFGHKAVAGRVSMNDLHATMLHLLGIDHKRLKYHFNGRDFRLTDVAG